MRYLIIAFVILGAVLAARAEPAPPEGGTAPPGAATQSPAAERGATPSASLSATGGPAGLSAAPADGAGSKPRQAIDLASVCPEIGSAAAAHNLPRGFLVRLIWQESRFDPTAVSRAGAQGIAQFMPATARWRGLANPFDPIWAVRESARWLGELRSQFGNLGLAAAAYNAGPKRVQDWLAGRRALPGETRAYVSIITGRFAEEWARPGVRDDNQFLPAPPDCKIKEGFRRIALGPMRLNLRLPDIRRPGARHEPASAPPTWSLQLTGDRSEMKALADFKGLQKRFPRILGSRKPVVTKRQLGGRIPVFWYQVRVAEASRERATALCTQLRLAGGQCLVLSN